MVVSITSEQSDEAGSLRVMSPENFLHKNIKTDKEDIMKKYLLLTVALLISFSVAMPVLAQYGPGWRDDSGWYRGRGMEGGMMGSGYGMGPGMMSSPYWLTVPEKLLPPKNAEWVANLRELLTLEEKAFDQYITDQEKYNAAMPYMMVTPQVEDHVETLQRLIEAYGLIPGGRIPGPVVETKSLKESFELAVKTEGALIPRYLWLVQKAEDRFSARVLNHLLLQARIHLAMFQHALSMGGQGMGPGMTGGGTGGGVYVPYRLDDMTPWGVTKSLLGACQSIPYFRPDEPVDMAEAKMLMGSCIKSTRNPNLKLGKIKDQGTDYEAEILTKSNMLIDRILIDKKTGWMRSAY